MLLSVYPQGVRPPLEHAGRARPGWTGAALPRLPALPGLLALPLLLIAATPARPAAWSTTVAADAATAARLEAHRQATAHLTSIQADVVTHTPHPLRRTIGRVVLRGPDAYYRVAETRGGEERPLQESVATAARQVTISYEAGVATRVDLARVRAADPNIRVPHGARDVLDAFARAAPGSVRYLGPAIRGEATLDRFRIAATVGEGPAGELLVWVAPADGLPRRVELRGPSGQLLLEREFVNVKVDAPIPDALFTLTIPPGITVHDVSDEYLAQEPPPAAPPH